MVSVTTPGKPPEIDVEEKPWKDVPYDLMGRPECPECKSECTLVFRPLGKWRGIGGDFLICPNRCWEMEVDVVSSQMNGRWWRP